MEVARQHLVKHGAALIRDLGVDDAPIVAVGPAAHVASLLQAVDETGDVGPRDQKILAYGVHREALLGGAVEEHQHVEGRSGQAVARQIRLARTGVDVLGADEADDHQRVGRVEVRKLPLVVGHPGAGVGGEIVHESLSM